MIGFLKQIFTWWYRQTLGTFIYTLFFGKSVGSDQFGNKYYTNRKGKRWVIYKKNIEASKIPPDWHLWIHHLRINLPIDKGKKYSWQKEHVENLTGTSKAHKPDGLLSNIKRKNMKKYETWKV